MLKNTTDHVYLGFGHPGPEGRFIRFLIQNLKALNYPFYVVDDSYSMRQCS